MLRLTRDLAATMALALAGCSIATAAAPELLHTPNYESPVTAGPDDLLLLGGAGFHPTDRVVYVAAGPSATVPVHPAAVPSRSDADAGVASVVRPDDETFGIVVRLPETLRKDRPYRLWVVTERKEWSVPVTINDVRPQWLSPTYVYATADFAGLGRKLRIVGRNMGAAGESGEQIRLSGPATYVLSAGTHTDGPSTLRPYVLEVALPTTLVPGRYGVSVHRVEAGWTELSGQVLEVRADPRGAATFSLDDTRYGGCRPGDGIDDSSCLVRAIEAAAHSGGGTVLIPPGTWDLATDGLDATKATDGFILPRGVDLRGNGPKASFIVRHGAPGTRRPDTLFTLTGHNTVSGISFTDEAHFTMEGQSRPVIQLGATTASAVPAGASDWIEDIVITGNVFRRVGRGISNHMGYPIARLFITHNEFGAYSEGIQLPGNPARVVEPYRIDDAVIRWNRFAPGSYIDISAHQGAIATGMGAADRVDFSSNVAAGDSTEALQDTNDPRGFRAAFFWNMTSDIERLLVADNHVACSGDKAGDGEAFSFDANADTFAFDAAPVVSAAGQSWVTVRGLPMPRQLGNVVPHDTYYKDHWVKIVAGEGLGQTRRVASYVEDADRSMVTFNVSPAWDVPPAPGTGRISVDRQHWQVLVVANDVDHRSPPCRKSNLNGPSGGVIALWTPAADSVIAANRQRDTNGIVFAQHYSAPTASCPTCPNFAFLQSAVEIRDNDVDGEYDWDSNCSPGGISGSFGASRAPESTPPTLGFGVVIANNRVARSDGQGGGAIDMAMTSFPGPPPGNWTFNESLLVFHNEIQDMQGPAPRVQCSFGGGVRTGIRLSGHDNYRGTVLYANRCQRVDKLLDDGGKGTTRVCPAASVKTDNCECPTQP